MPVLGRATTGRVGCWSRRELVVLSSPGRAESTLDGWERCLSPRLNDEMVVENGALPQSWPPSTTPDG